MTTGIMLIAAALIAGGDGFVVAERGKAAEVAVVLPAKPSESQRYAADELVKYICQMTGVKLGIGKKGASRTVELRSTGEFGKDGYSIAVEGSRLVIAGSARRGCLYGVYDLLERFGGCTFCSSRHEDIPKCDRFSVPRGTSIVEKPAIAIREALSYDIIHSAALAAKLRKNRSLWSEIPEKFGGNELRPSHILRGHTFDKLVPVKKYFREHPEYFSEIDGRRIGERPQLCLSNPEVREIAKRKLLETMRAEPQAEMFSISQNDWYNQCQCANCRALDAAAGSSSGAFVDFLNFLARAAAKEFPGKLLRSSAYQWTRPPPKNVKLEPNVFFGVAPIECDFSVPINRSEYPTNAVEYAELLQWAKAAKTLHYTDYTCNFRYYPLFFPNLETTAGNMKLLRDLGCKSVYGLGPHDTDCGFMQELRAWIFQKLAWNPDQPLWPLVERFCRAFYGPGADEVIAYVRDLESLPRDRVKDPMLIYYKLSSPTFTEEFLVRSLRRWNAAEEAVKDNPRLLDNVRRGKFSVVYAILCRKALIPVTGDRSKFEEYRKTVKWAVDFIESSPGPIRIYENGPLFNNTAFFATWRNIANKKTDECSRISMDGTFFDVYREGEWAETVKDTLAEDGKAIKIFNTTFQWALHHETDCIGLEPGGRYRLRVRVRVEPKPGANPEAEAFYCGIGNKIDRNDPCKGNKGIKLKDAGAGYQWYSLGEFTKSPGQYVWMASGRFDNKKNAENPDIAAVYVDTVEISCVEPVRRINMLVRQTRGNENIRPIQEIDKAAWIWADEPPAWGEACVSIRTSSPRDVLPQRFYRFRNDFAAAGAPLRFHVSADERFILFLDGKEIARGPHRGMPDHWFYQSYEAELAPGGHRLEAICWQLGAHAPLAQLSYRGGFIFKAEGDYDAKLTTGKAKWRVAALKTTEMTGQGKNRCWGVGSESKSVGTSFYDETPVDGAWREAVEVRAPVRDRVAVGLVCEGWKLFPSGIADQMREYRRPGAFKASRPDAFGDEAFRGDDAKGAFVDELNSLLSTGKSITIPPGTSLRAIWDLGNYYCAYPELVTAGGRGAEIRWKWTESLFDSKEHKKDREAFADKKVNGPFGDVFLPDGRGRAVFTSPWWRCGRWCQLEIKTGDEPLKLKSLGFYETRYPYENVAKFECDDASIPDIRRICTRALQMCSHEMFFDCPHYEQQMYPGDSRVQFLVQLATSTDPRLVGQSIAMFDEARRPNGMIPMNFPSRMTQECSTYTMCWLYMLRDWLRWCGKDDFLKARLPGMRHTISAFEKYENEDGLLVDFPGWKFVDYTHVTSWTSGIPPHGRKDGLSAPENLQYLLAMRCVAEVEAAFGEQALAARMTARAERLRAAIIAKFWCASRGLVADTTDFDCFSEDAQALAVVAGALDGAQRAAVAKGLEEATDLVRSTVYFSHYLFDAYFDLGLERLFFKRLDLWRDYVKCNMSTLQEAPPKPDGRDPRSDCHAWGAHPLYHLNAHMAGIQPLEPGFTSVRIAPRPGPLGYIRATTPTPHGVVEVDLRFVDGKAVGSVSLPVGVKGEFVWNGRTRALAPGRTTMN